MSFEKWNPKDYLSHYYLTEGVAEDEIHILKFCLEFLKSGNHHFSEALEVGSGPTVNHAAPFAPYVDSIYLSDYLDSNLEEIKKWLNQEEGAHNWGTYLDKEQASLLRQKVKELLHCDIFLSDPLSINKKFPLVTSFYCADSATHSKEAWELAMGNIFNLVAPDGWFVMSALEKAKSYKVGSLNFHSAEVNERDVKDVFQNLGFKQDSIVIKVVPISTWKDEGFDGIIIARAQRP